MVLTTAITLCSNISWDASHSSFCLYCHFGHVWNFWKFLDPFWQLLVEILWSVPNLPKNISFSEKFETFPKSKNNQNELWLPSRGVLLHMEVLWWLMECSGSQEVQHLWKKTENFFSQNIQLWALNSSKLYAFIALDIWETKLHLLCTCERKMKLQSLLFPSFLLEM